MTNATKTLSVVFAGLLVLTVLMKWVSHPSSSKAFRSTIVDVDTAKVNKVLIDSPGEDQAITLQKKASGWQVKDNLTGKSYPADNELVSRAIGALNHLDVKAVATRDPQRYTRYKADSTGTKVLLFNGNTRLAGVIVGAPQFVSRREFNSYVRPVNDQAVYTVNGFLGSSFSPDASRWRDKKVWKLAQGKISRVDFLFPADSSYSMKKVAKNKWISDNDTLDTSGVSSVLSQFSPLRVNNFVDSLSISDFGTERYAVQLHMDNGDQKTIRIKPFSGHTSQYLAIASGYPYVFTLSKSMWKNLVLKSCKKLLKKKAR